MFFHCKNNGNYCFTEMNVFFFSTPAPSQEIHGACAVMSSVMSIALSAVLCAVHCTVYCTVSTVYCTVYSPTLIQGPG